MYDTIRDRNKARESTEFDLVFVWKNADRLTKIMELHGMPTSRYPNGETLTTDLGYDLDAKPKPDQHGWPLTRATLKNRTCRASCGACHCRGRHRADGRSQSSAGCVGCGCPLRSSENTAGTCPYKGMAYFNSLGWSVILSDGRKTLDVVLSRRANSIRAFD